MSEEQRKVGFAVTAENQTKPAFDEIKRDAADMASKVEESGKRAAKGVGAVGDGGDQAAKKLDASTRSIIGSIQRATAATEAGEKGTSKYFETLAKQRGIGGDVLEPYLAQMRKAEAAQALSVKSLGSMEMTAKQTTAALRQVPAQFTDIIVSLQGGQAPMTVFLQQGGQLKDVFGGAGAAAKALSGYVLGLVNPFTLTAAAVAAVGIAYNQGSKEHDAFIRSIVTTGNASGVTTSQLRDYARAIDSVVGTQAQASEGLAAFVAAGVRGGDELRKYTQTAIEWEKATGQAVSKTAEQFASLQKDPLAAVLKLNDGTNFLTTSVYEQIKALTEQGRSADASKVAMDALDTAMRERGKAIEQSLGYIERGWRGLKNVAKEAWDAMLNVGRASTPADTLAKVREEMARLQKQSAGGFGETEGGAAMGRPSQAAVARINDRIAALKAEETQLVATMDAESKRAQEQEKSARSVDARSKWDQAGEQFLSKQVQMERELAKAREEGKAAGASVAEIEERLAGIREKYKDKGAEKAARAHNAELERQRSLLAELAGLSSSFYKDWDTLSKMGLPIAELEKAQADLLAKQPAMVAGAKAEADALKLRVKAYEDEVKAQQKLLDQRQNAASQVEDSLRKAREEEQAHAMAAASGITLAEALAQIALARAEDNYQKALGAGADAETLLALQREIEARKGLIEVMRDRGVREANKRAGDDAAKDWERTAQTISGTLADYIMSGGKNAAQYLKRLFATLVLQPTVQTLVGGILGTGPAAAASGGSNILGTASNLGSLGAFGGTVSAGLSYGATSLFANGLGTTLAAGGQMIGAGSIVSGISTIAGALGPIALGVAALTSLVSSLDDSGTPHAGAGAVYAGGKVTGGRDVYSYERFNLADMNTYSAGVQDIVSPVAQSVGSALDAFATAFGQQAGYTVATAFADDSSKDGAWGALRIEDALGRVLIDWDQDRQSKWAPRVFSDGEEGQKQYLALIAQDTRQVLLDMDLPQWADTMLESIGDAADMDKLSAVINQIAVVNTAFVQLGNSMSMFADISGELQTNLLNAAGGIDALVNSAGAFYQGFYSEAERMDALRGQLNTALTGLDLTIDPNLGEDAKAQFRRAVEDAMDAGDAELAASLLAISGNFATAADYFEQLSQTAADAAKKAAEDARKALIDSTYDMFRRLVDRDRDLLSGQASAISEVIGQISTSVDMLKSNARDLYGTVDSSAQMLAAQGMVYIEDALAGLRGGASITGYTGLQDAVTAARGGITNGIFANDAERAYETLRLAGQLAELGDLGDAQLTAQERQLKALQQQIEYLDTLQQRADDLVNGTAALTGTVDDYFKQLLSLLGGGDEGAAGTSVGGSSGGAVFGGTSPGGIGFAQPDPTKYSQVRADGSGGTWYDPIRDESVIAHLDKLAPVYHAFDGTGDLAGLAEAIKAAGGTVDDLSMLSGYYASDWRKALEAAGIPAFAQGINRVPFDMPAVLHRDELVVPARFNPFNPGAQQWGGGNTERLERLVEGLTAQVISLEDRLKSIEDSAQSTADVLVRVTRNGNAMVVEDAPA